VKGICKNAPTQSKTNPRITGVEGEVQAKVFSNIFNKINTENHPHLENTMPTQEASRTPNKLDQNRTTP
jgi:hypothetical protein